MKITHLSSLALYALCLNSPSLHGSEILDNPEDLPQTSPGNTTYLLEHSLHFAMSGKQPYTSYDSGMNFRAANGHEQSADLSFQGEGNATAAISTSGTVASLSFEHLGAVSFTGFTARGAFAMDSLLFEACRSVTASDNGNGFSSFNNITFLYTKEKLEISNNTQSGISGGGFVLFQENQGQIAITGNGSNGVHGGNISLLQNSLTSLDVSGNGSYGLIAGNGGVDITGNRARSITLNDNGDGAICAQVGTLLIQNNSFDTWSFCNNGSLNWAGGALRTTRNDIALIANSGSITFAANKASRGGALHAGDSALILGNRGSLTFADNTATSRGGAILVSNQLTLSGQQGDILFSNNRAGEGGAIYAAWSATMENNRGDILFEGNAATTPGRGGAIDTGNLVIAGNAGNVVFRGNYRMTGDSLNPLVLQSVHGHSFTHDWDFAAPEGGSILFEDPISTVPGGSITLNLNKSPNGTSHRGDIIFSGKNTRQLLIDAYKAQADMTAEKLRELERTLDEACAASRYSAVTASTTLYGGRFLLEDKVVFGDKALPSGSSFTAREGSTLGMVRGATLNAATFSMEEGSVLCAGSGATLNALTVDLSHGLTFDFTPFLHGGDSGLAIAQAGSLTLGGALRIHDADNNAAFYADESWAQERRLTTLTLDAASASAARGEMEGVESLATGSNKVDSPYLYRGSWSSQWSDTDGDGIDDTLTTIWTPAGGGNAPTDILPELEGALAMNTLWSSASNMRSVSRAALGTLGSHRFQSQAQNEFWARGLGDFSRHDSAGTRDGYEYHGGGYAAGGDCHLTPHAILGAAFGNLFGRNTSSDFAGKVRQTSAIGMLYGGWYREVAPGNALALSGTAGYGTTENTMDATHTGGSSHGRWDNDSFFATLESRWERTLPCAWQFDVMLGVEYTDITQQAFTETGWDVRQFDKGHLRNLALPMGLALSRTSSLLTCPCTVSLAVRYVPDVYREDPKATAQRLQNGFRWQARGIAPDRNAVRVNLDSALELSARCSLNAGYEFEGRGRSTEHRIQAGATFSF